MPTVDISTDLASYVCTVCRTRFYPAEYTSSDHARSAAYACHGATARWTGTCRYCGDPTPDGADWCVDPDTDTDRGHDAKALYERAGRVGTIAEFCDWFDGLVGPFDS